MSKIGLVLPRLALLSILTVLVAPCAPAVQSEDVAAVPSEEVKIAGNERQIYYLIGPKEGAKRPTKGFGLVVVMPGGNGSKGFHAFVERIWQNALGDQYVVAQPVAVRWTEDQKIVWPTARSRVTGMKFTTEAFVEAVISDVKKRRRIDPRRVFTLSWSSSGPAAYAISLQKKTAVCGSYVAMSVFKPELLPGLKRARGHAYLIDHSPNDQVCPFAHAEAARTKLAKAGAKTKLVTYKGGHGWHGNVYARIRQGFEWLERKKGRPRR